MLHVLVLPQTPAGDKKQLLGKYPHKTGRAASSGKWRRDQSTKSKWNPKATKGVLFHRSDTLWGFTRCESQVCASQNGTGRCWIDYTGFQNCKRGTEEKKTITGALLHNKQPMIRPTHHSTHNTVKPPQLPLPPEPQLLPSINPPCVVWWRLSPVSAPTQGRRQETVTRQVTTRAEHELINWLIAF